MGQIIALIGNKQFQNIALTQLFTIISTNLLAPVLPVYLKLHGYTDTQIGVAMGVLSVGALVVRPWAGRSVDTLGSRPVLLFGQALTGLCITAYFWVISFTPVVVVRLLQGIAAAFCGTASVTFASCVETPENTAGAIALYSVFTMLGMGVATSSAPVIFGATDFRHLALLSLFFLLAGVGIMVFRAKPVLPCTGVERTPFVNVLRSNRVLAPTVCLFASNFTFGTAFTFVPLMALAEHVSSYGMFYAAFTVAVVSARLTVSRLTGVFSAEKTATYASILNALSMLLMACKAAVVTFVLSGILLGLGFGIIYPSMAAYVVNHVHPANRGTALSILSASGDVGNALGASVLGFIADLYGYRTLFLVSTAVVLLCTYQFYAALVCKRDCHACSDAN